MDTRCPSCKRELKSSLNARLALKCTFCAAQLKINEHRSEKVWIWLELELYLAGFAALVPAAMFGLPAEHVGGAFLAGGLLYALYFAASVGLTPPKNWPRWRLDV